MWNRELIAKLIEKYKTFPELWDPSSPHYKNKLKKQSAVQNIATDFNMEESEVKNKIHNLRTQLLQELRRMRKKTNGKSTADHQKSKWEFFDALKFIVTENETSSIAWTDENKSTANFEETPSTNEERKSKKRSCIETPNKTDDILIKTRVSVIDRTTDEHQLFCDYIASEFRLLKSDRSRTQLRRKIQRAILEVSENDSDS